MSNKQETNYKPPGYLMKDVGRKFCYMAGTLSNTNYYVLCIYTALCPGIDVHYLNLPLESPYECDDYPHCAAVETEAQEGWNFSQC